MLTRPEEFLVGPRDAARANDSHPSHHFVGREAMHSHDVQPNQSGGPAQACHAMDRHQALPLEMSKEISNCMRGWRAVNRAVKIVKYKFVPLELPRGIFHCGVVAWVTDPDDARHPEVVEVSSVVVWALGIDAFGYSSLCASGHGPSKYHKLWAHHIHIQGVWMCQRFIFGQIKCIHVKPPSFRGLLQTSHTVKEANGDAFSPVGAVKEWDQRARPRG
mmetsp:Transcript_53456/g.109040  ORF Transcript_53456/g.109040 Transcript_53456/m.109040 type:complete len:218 (-) Transcript_53456:1034-1687(-)